MKYLDDTYSSEAGFARFPEIVSHFPFTSRLKPAHFPASFIESYVSFGLNNPIDYDAEKIFFKARFTDNDEIFWFDCIFDPQRIQMQNGIISESSYAEGEDAVIMPPGHYTFGAAYGEILEMRLMINLLENSKDYGKIYLWTLAYDALGIGDNTKGLAYLADDLLSFISQLRQTDML